MLHTLEITICSRLDCLLDLVIRSALLNANSKVDNRHVGRGHTHGHASELAVEVGDDLADSLSGTSAAGDDVLSSTTASAPVLGGGAVDCLLGSGVRMHSGHETLNDGVFVVDNLGERRKAVGGARSVGNDRRLAVVGLLVDAHDEHGSVRRGCSDDNLLGAALQMCFGLGNGGEDTCGLHNVLGACLRPRNAGRVPLSVELDALAIDNEVLAVNLDGALEGPVSGVVLEHVRL